LIVPGSLTSVRERERGGEGEGVGVKEGREGETGKY